MTAEELAPFRALLRAQAMAPPRATLARRLRGLVGAAPDGLERPPTQALPLSHIPPVDLTAAPLAGHADRLFGRREFEAEAPAPPPPPESERAPLLLTTLLAPCAAPVAAAAGRVSLRVRPESLAQTPYLPEDLHDERPAAPPRPARQAPAPGEIAGWSVERPASAQHRLLSRILAVVEAEAQGLCARRAALAA